MGEGDRHTVALAGDQDRVGSGGVGTGRGGSGEAIGQVLQAGDVERPATLAYLAGAGPDREIAVALAPSAGAR